MSVRANNMIVTVRILVKFSSEIRIHSVAGNVILCHVCRSISNAKRGQKSHLFFKLRYLLYSNENQLIIHLSFKKTKTQAIPVKVCLINKFLYVLSQVYVKCTVFNTFLYSRFGLLKGFSHKLVITYNHVFQPSQFVVQLPVMAATKKLFS